MVSEIDEAVAALRGSWYALKARIREPAEPTSYKQPAQIEHIFYLVAEVERAVERITATASTGLIEAPTEGSSHRLLDGTARIASPKRVGLPDTFHP
jgi:hypothetical protein